MRDTLDASAVYVLISLGADGCLLQVPHPMGARPVPPEAIPGALEKAAPHSLSPP